MFMGNCHTWDRCTSPTPHKTTSLGGDETDDATRAKWQGSHPTTYQKSFPGVEKWEVVAWIMEVYWSVH